MRAIRKRAYRTVSYVMDVTPKYVKGVEEWIKANYKVNGYEEWELTVEDVMYAYCESYGHYDEWQDESLVNLDLLNATVNHNKNTWSMDYSMMDLVAEVVEEDIWNDEADEIDDQCDEINTDILNYGELNDETC